MTMRSKLIHHKIKISAGKRFVFEHEMPPFHFVWLRPFFIINVLKSKRVTLCFGDASLYSGHDSSPKKSWRAQMRSA